VEASICFSDKKFPELAASSDSCTKRVDVSNQVLQQTKEHMTAKTDRAIECSFDTSFAKELGEELGVCAPVQSQVEPVESVKDGKHTNFAFSSTQLKGPVVIEVFCGSARVTAFLKELGLKESFGVDHVLDKATSTAKRLDLTIEADQKVFLQWLHSPLVVGVFLAPPCGTCSSARNIQLRDEKGRKIQGPRPLRSSTWPEGLPGLSDRDKARVSAANKLYDFVATIVTQAHSLGLLVVVENPRSSIFWLTRFWKSIQVPMHYTAHQACAYGGERPKWTVLAWNHSGFSIINRCCPGEGDHHKHKPWGLVKSEVGTHFSTSEEAAYPRGLAHAIAKVFAEILASHGWNPPQEELHGTEVTLKSMRAAATAQPKASKMPPVVREHKYVVLVTGPYADLCTVPILPMQRLKSTWEVPETCNSSVLELPVGAQLLRQTPLRSCGGGLNQKFATEKESAGDVFEQAWGVPFSPEEFMEEAVSRGHPKLFARLVPEILQVAIQNNFQTATCQNLPAERARWFAKWTARAKQLSQVDAELKSTLPHHAACILEPKRLTLFKEILVDVGYPDLGVYEELVNGTELVGEVKPFGIFEKAFRPAEITTEQLKASGRAARLLNFYKCSSSGDAEVDDVVYNKTLEEVELGWALGPMELSDLPPDAVVSKRFGLKQPAKIRLIDDLSSSKVNQTVQTAESPKPHSVDFIAAMLLEVLKFNKGVQLFGRSFDLKSAYQQLAIAEKSLSFAFVAVYNPRFGKAELFQLLAAPFGATRSVYSFLRVSNAIWYIGVKALNIIWSCFFDDYVSFCREEHISNTNMSVSLLFKLLGWKFAEEGDKADDFAKEFGALGIRIILDNSAAGLVKFTNTEKRSAELTSIINNLISKGTMTLVESQRLRGRMQFMDGQLFGRLGKLCMREVTNHSLTPTVTKLSKKTMDAMQRFVVFLQHAEPRQLHLNSDTVSFIYRDACYEPTSASWQCGLGGVLVGPNGVKVDFFSIALDKDQMEVLGAGLKKTIIFEAELLALVVAFSAWRKIISAMSVLCFVDNNSARDVAISGSGRNVTANLLIEALLKLEMATCTTPWYSRVPTPSNIADDPSRGEIHELVKNSINQTCVKEVLSDILLFLAEATVMGGHAG